MYVPQIGLTIALAWGAWDLAHNTPARRALAAAAVAALAALSTAAWVQVGFWRDSFTLFERVLAISPNAYLPHSALATAHLRAGRIELAGRFYQRAFEIDPAQGREPLVHFELGAADLARQNSQPDTALEHWRTAVRVDPEHARARRLLGLALLARNRPAEAKPHLEQALRLAPGQRAVRNDLAWLLATSADPSLRSPDEAVRLAEELDRADPPPSANELDTLAAAYAAAGRYEDAVRAADRASALAQQQAPQLAGQIERRARDYRRGRAWVDPPSADSGAAALPSSER
jgi:spermidine synthase